MSKRGAGGLRRIGSESLAGDLLPSRIGRGLRLAVAWREVAGPELSRRTEPLGLSRGVLDVRVAEERWLRALAELLPAVIARLSASRPELGIRRYRVCVAPSTPTGRSLAVPVDAGPPPAAREIVPKRAETRAELTTESLEARLRSVAGRYLERTLTRRMSGC